jgi:hypothetical protein
VFPRRGINPPESFYLQRNIKTEKVDLYIYMSWLGFKLMISVFEPSKIMHRISSSRTFPCDWNYDYFLDMTFNPSGRQVPAVGSSHVLSIIPLNNTKQFILILHHKKLLFREIIAVYCENHTEHINTLCGQNAEFSSYFTGNTLRLCYKAQPVNAV